ncbi:MAG TPA: hypothetical protein VHC44_18125, partial [Verrucomicrobiae bacterium]|nr:hypothetical protein [Verrucomicrobiae bacterium]
MSASAQAAEVQTNSALEIKGTITKIDGTGNETNWTDFTVCVFNEKCQVSNLYFNKELLENGTDGTNAYFLNKMTKAKRLIKDWWEWGSVSAGRFPINGMAPGQLCWLAYGSSGYFATNSPAVPMESFQQNAAFLHCEIELSAAQPHLPERIRWYGSNFWYLRANGPGNKESVPYDQGFLAGDYRVTEVTNFQGLHLPAGFEFSVFIPSFFGKKLAPDAVTLVEILRARISSIKAIPMLSDFRPT